MNEWAGRVEVSSAGSVGFFVPWRMGFRRSSRITFCHPSASSTRTILATERVDADALERRSRSLHLSQQHRTNVRSSSSGYRQLELCDQNEYERCEDRNGSTCTLGVARRESKSRRMSGRKLMEHKYAKTK
ncbi:hypothetical protein K439DRAFT_58848 [Ramaria rubella]|nr:hypothetical protein K439DRAFT_58848 [Ramaria rubella]